MEIKVGQVYKGNRAMQSAGKLKVVEINGDAVKVKNHNSEGWTSTSKMQTNISIGLLVLIIGA